ncbi:MAG: hypothetical protein JWP27_2865 [Flaviaesturariibacter sp.]|nr:hypothetical protein [Flaviaesturariibacter sp.]
MYAVSLPFVPTHPSPHKRQQLAIQGFACFLCCYLESNLSRIIGFYNLLMR